MKALGLQKSMASFPFRRKSIGVVRNNRFEKVLPFHWMGAAENIEWFIDDLAFSLWFGSYPPPPPGGGGEGRAPTNHNGEKGSGPL